MDCTTGACPISPHLGRRPLADLAADCADAGGLLVLHVITTDLERRDELRWLQKEQLTLCHHVLTEDTRTGSRGSATVD